MNKLHCSFLLLIACYASYSYKLHNYEDAPPEFFDMYQEDELSAKFKPGELESLLSELKKPKEDEGRGRKLGFAEVAPDVILERLVEETDEEDERSLADEGKPKKTENRKVVEKTYGFPEDINDDLDDAL